MSEYPKDEFDLAAEERGPKGVHRRAESKTSRLLPFLLVLILGPLLAWGVVSLLNRDADEGPPAADATPTETATDEAEDPSEEPDDGDPNGEAGEPEGDDPEGDEEEPADEPGDAPIETGVSVLNGSASEGLADRVGSQVTEDGFSNVTTGNYQSALPEISAVFYQRAELLETAQRVADLLGIGPVEILESASNEIVVVLRGDFAE